jgi:hypothetical protein
MQWFRLYAEFAMDAKAVNFDLEKAKQMAEWLRAADESPTPISEHPAPTITPEPEPPSPILKHAKYPDTPSKSRPRSSKRLL